MVTHLVKLSRVPLCFIRMVQSDVGDGRSLYGITCNIFINGSSFALLTTVSRLFNNNTISTINTTTTIIIKKRIYKDREIVKQQISKWKVSQIYQMIYDVNNIELQIKKNFQNSQNLLFNFLLDKSSKISNTF